MTRRLMDGSSDAKDRSAARKIVEKQLVEVEKDAAPWLRDSVAEAFERLWQPVGQPATEPTSVVNGVIQRQMNRLYYHVSARTWKDTFYRGTPLYKCPTDMWVYQELIDDLRPGLVIETGTFRGGSALFIADRLEMSGHGEIITIDITSLPDQPQHPRLSYLVGSSTAPDMLEEVRRRLPTDGSPVLVILDSDHTQGHVADELRAYGPMVTDGSYLIVEHTNVNGHPVAPQHGPGPWEAVADFLDTTDNFEVDPRGERYFLTQNPSGYLRKIGTSGDTEAMAAPPAAPTLRRDPVDIATAALAGTTTDAAEPAVVLVLPGVRPGQMFAGLRTAVHVGAAAAARSGRRLHVVTADDSPVEAEALHADIAGQIRGIDDVAVVADRLRVSSPGRHDDAHHIDDIWIVTYWTTALAVAELVRRGLVDRARVVYLIQDFEPGFFAWGHRYAQAWTTYHLGFVPLVNSRSLAGFLTAQGVAGVDDDLVFAPAIDVEPIRRASAAWTPAPGETRVLFYARPSKPRNMYDTGLAALRLWADNLTVGRSVTVTFAGEEIRIPPIVADGVEVRMVGQLDFEEYLAELARTDVGLSLMLSPHPSHLALELPMSGAPSVTNQFGGVREAWVPGLHVAEANERSIAEAITVAADAAAGLTSHEFHEVPTTLGRPLDDAVSAVVQRVDPT